MNEHEMRAAYERALEAADKKADVTAVPLDQLDALVHQSGSESDRLRTLDLAMSSAQGRREFEIALAAARATAGAARAASAAATPPGRRAFSMRWLGMAAALIVSTGVGAVWVARRPAAERVESMRGSESPVQLVAPRGQIDQAPGTRFSWRAVPSARSYTLVLVDRGGTERYASSTSDTSLTLPSSVALQPGEHYLWWVQAELVDGTTLSAVTESLTVRPRRR